MTNSAHANVPSVEGERPGRPSRGRRRRGALMRVLMLSALGAVILSGTSSIEPELAGLASALGHEAGCIVDPSEIRWEPAQGAVADLVRGRNVLFLGRPTAGAPRDVYRARVRLTWEGKPIGISSSYNLTSTPLGDDHALVLQGTQAAFATAAFGQEQSVTLLDLEPVGSAATARLGLGARTMRWLTNLQETGDGAGIRRVDVTLDPPGRRVGLALEGRSLRVDVADDRAIKTASVDLDRLEVAGEASRLKLEVVARSPKRLVHWAVDTVRAVSWIGPAPIAWLEERWFALRDEARKAAFHLQGSTDEVRADAQATLSAPVLEGTLASRDEEAWPPPAVLSIWKTPEAGEGEWTAPKIGWVKRLENPAAPPAFVRTFVRPDNERPYARVLLVAMDTRRLDLSMVAGSEDPKPLVGTAGPGRLPRDPAIATQVVAAFNGAFKTEHGFHGMMVQKRVLLPPVPGSATVVVLKDGRTGLGTWGPSKEVTGIRGVPDADIVSLRQNLDPLVDRGEVNPSKRSIWGFTLPGTSMQTERSGICVTGSGHLLYAWGDDVSGITLAKAMKLAGCTYGMHLDMNPHHTGFMFANIDDLKARKYKTELLTSDMEIPSDRYIEHSAKDFFYLTVREPTPAPAGKSAWSVAKGAQPPPAWFPGLFETELAAVQLFDIERGRAAFRIRRGTAEPEAGAGHTPPVGLDESDASRVLFALGIGVSHDKRPRGLAVSGRAVAPVHAAEGTAVLVSDGGTLSIRRHDELGALAPAMDYAELPLLFASAETRSYVGAALAPGALRAALGTTEDGRVIVARSSGTVEALADALRVAGCSRAVLLDRGARAQGTFDRSQTPSPPRASYEESVLYGIARSMKPRAFRFEADTVVAAAPR